MTIRRGLTRSACALCASITACGLPSEPDPILWQGELVADAAADDVRGNVAMVAGSNDTLIGIALTSAPAENTLRWVIRVGRCETSGAPIAPASTFPDLTTSDVGEAAAETIVRRRLAGSTAYAAEVFFTTDASTVRAACAELERVR
jgi:hypothetical protein